MNRILLAYCRDNAQLAAEIDQKLSRIGIPFEHITDQDGNEQGYMANYLSSTSEPVLLLVTDNFLKSAGCLSGMLSAIQTMTRERRIATVVADGRRSEDGGASYLAVPTHFDRMVYALQYMNHWQSTWLELSDRHSHAESAAKEAMLEELNATRNIANEMGDLISALRESGYVSYAEFSDHDFAAFFQRFGLQHWHEQYKHIVAQETAAPAPADTAPLDQTASAPEAAIADIPGDLAHENGHEPASVSIEPPSGTNAGTAHLERMDTLLHHMGRETPETEIDLAVEVEAPVLLRETEPYPKPAPEIWPETTATADPTGDSDAAVEQHINDAWFWLENGHTERGFDLLAAAIEQYPDHPLLQEALQKAHAQYRQTTELATSPSLPVPEVVPAVMPQLMNSEARSYELMGDMAMQKGDFLFAKYCWDRTVELAPTYPGIYRKLGMMVTENLREYRETGMQYLKEALSQNPADAAVHLALARVARQNNEPEAAEVYYRSAVATDPTLKTVDNDLLFLPEYALHTPEKQPESLAAEPETPVGEEQAPETPPAVDETNALPGEPSLAATQETPADAMPDAALSDTGTGAEHPDAPALPEAPAVSQAESNAMETRVPEEALTPDADLEALFPSPTNDPTPAPTALIRTAAAEPKGHLAPDSMATTVVPKEETPPAPSAVVPDAIPFNPTPEPAREVLTVLVTGATSGIGRATAELFARHGHRLILTGRRVDRLSDLKKHFESELPETDVLMLPFDVRDPGAVRAALDNLPEAWREVDVLINNAGLAKGLAPIHEGDLDHWETMIDTNIKGLLYVTRTVAPSMVRRRRGHIVNIGSIAGKEIYPSGNVYCASKAAVDALTHAMRLDLHAHNIRVSQVSPGHVEETEFALNRFDGDAARGAKVYEGFQPLKAGDVAEVIYFMVTRPAHVNIQDVVMYGTQQASATVIDRSGR